jgi:two-component system alkaline phosphatase synthesis response regulator PhoP
MKAKRILIVEDNEHLADGLRLNLELEGYEPVVAASAEEGLHFRRRGGLDLILLDVMLPGMDGFAFCRKIREEGDRTPVLFLTARNQEDDRVRGLEVGGDDYITKPFHLRELLARVKGIFRREEWRHESSAPDKLMIGGASVDLRALTLTNAEGVHALKEKEALILKLLAEKEGDPVPRRMILDRIWGYDAFPTTRTVDNFILNLRKLVELDPSKPDHIQTVHGVGYRLVR